MIFYTFLILFITLILFGTFFIVKQQSAAIVERFGKFISTRQSGLQLKIPIVDRVAGKLTLRIQQLDVVVETKTKVLQMYQSSFVNVNMNAGRHGDEKFEYDEEHCQLPHMQR